MAIDDEACALQLFEDLDRLTAVWQGEGDAALLARVRADPALTFAVRRLPEGSELIVMRSIAPPDDIEITYHPASTGYYYKAIYRQAAPPRSRAMPMGFLASDDGERIVIARSEGGMVLFTEGTLDAASIAPMDNPLAEHLAGYLGIGIDRRLDLPASITEWSAGDEVGLLSILDAADRYVTGRLRLAAAVNAISGHRAACGIGERDVDVSSAYAMDGCLFDANQFEYERDKRGGTWTVEQELAASEAFYSERATAMCRSLIARFREVPFGAA